MEIQKIHELSGEQRDIVHTLRDGKHYGSDIVLDSIGLTLSSSTD